MAPPRTDADGVELEDEDVEDDNGSVKLPMQQSVVPLAQDVIFVNVQPYPGPESEHWLPSVSITSKMPHWPCREQRVALFIAM